MYRKILAIVGIVCLVLIMQACSKPSPAPVVPKAGFTWPKTLVIETTEVGTSTHTASTGWAAKMEQSTGTKIRVLAGGVTAGRHKNFVGGSTDILAESISEIPLAFAGIGAHADVPKIPIGIVWQGNDTPWGWATLGNSKLNTVYDLANSPGIKIAIAAPSPAMKITTDQALPAFLGLTPEEFAKKVTFVPVSTYNDNVKALSQGKADVALVSPISAITYEEEANPRGLKWLDWPLTDKAGWSRFLDLRFSVPVEFTWGVKSAMGKYGYSSNYMYWARGDTDAELVYQEAKWLHQNYDAYKSTSEIASRMSLKEFRSFLDYNALPVHPGTIRYLKEIGQWTQLDDQRNVDATKLMMQYVQAWKAASGEAKTKGINIVADNKEWLDLWAGAKKGIPNFKVPLK